MKNTGAITPYKKDFGYSYAIGVFATLELLEHRPKEVSKVLISPEGKRNEGIEKINKICREKGIRVEEAGSAIIRISESENVYAIGVFSKYETKVLPHKNHVVLVNPSDMGNLGTVIRTMLAFGYEDLIIIKPAADVWSPKAIRASQGAMFQMRCEQFSNFRDYQKAFPGHNYYPFMLNGKTNLKKILLKTPYSLIFGNEGSGLGEEFRKIGESVKISQSDKVDSINLGVAVGIALYERGQ